MLNIKFKLANQHHLLVRMMGTAVIAAFFCVATFLCAAPSHASTPCDWGYEQHYGTSDQTCYPCRHGYYRDQLHDYCQRCSNALDWTPGIGTYDGAQCEYCDINKNWYFVVQDGVYNGQTTYTRDRMCYKSCPTDSEYDQTNKVFKKCQSGYVSDSTKCQCFPCPSGTYKDNSLGMTSCSQCPGGLYNPYQGQSQCFYCPVGQEPYGKSTCSDCKAGYYNAGNQYACYCCAAGQYQPGTGASSCVNCASYMYSAMCASGCSTCSGGYVPKSDRSGCQACGAGTYSPGSVASCITCPDGSYQDAGAQSSCKKCADGSVPTADKKGCTVCGVGTYALSGNSSCSVCPLGQYQNATSQSSCKYCLDGYVPNAAKSACSQCTAGNYAKSGDAVCSSCSTNTIQPLAGQASCTSCPIYQTSDSDHTYCMYVAATNIKILSVGVTAVQLDWDAVDRLGAPLNASIAVFRVSASPTRGGASSFYIASFRPYMIYGLAPATQYLFSVRVVAPGSTASGSSSSDSTYAFSGAIYTGTVTYPKSISDLSIDQITINSARLQWTALNSSTFEGLEAGGGATMQKQTVQVFIGSSLQASIDVGSKDSAYVVQGLAAETQYSFKVIRVNSQGYSSDSNVVSVTTHPAPKPSPSVNAEPIVSAFSSPMASIQADKSSQDPTAMPSPSVSAYPVAMQSSSNIVSPFASESLGLEAVAMQSSLVTQESVAHQSIESSIVSSNPQKSVVIATSSGVDAQLSAAAVAEASFPQHAISSPLASHVPTHQNNVDAQYRQIAIGAGVGGGIASAVLLLVLVVLAVVTTVACIKIASNKKKEKTPTSSSLQDSPMTSNHRYELDDVVL